MKTNAFKEFALRGMMPEATCSTMLRNNAYDSVDNEVFTTPPLTTGSHLNCDDCLNCDSKMIAVINMIKGIKNHINQFNLAKTCIERSRNIIVLTMVVQTIAVLTAFTAQAQTYNTGDIAVINAIISNNGLSWTTASTSGSSVPSDWTGVTWSSASTGKRITELNLAYQSLTGTLNVSALTGLTTIYANDNQLTGVNVTGNTALVILGVWANKITSLDISNNTELQQVAVGNNKLTSLDLSKNKKVWYLGVESNQLTALDVSNLSLGNFNADNNKLTYLDLKKSTLLGTFSATGQTPTVTLTYDSSSDNMKGTITLNNPTGLNSAVTYNGTQLVTATNSPSSTAFTVQTGFTGTGLSDASISGTMTLKYSVPAVYNSGDVAVINSMIDNNGLAWTKTGPSNVNSLTSQWTGGTTWSTRQYDKRITDINLPYQSMTGTLNVSALTELKNLYVNDNQLTGVNVAGNTALVVLGVWANKITSVDISNNTNLEQVAVGNNKLASLDLSNNKKVWYLSVESNQLTALDVSKLSLAYLNADNNKLTYLDLKKSNQCNTFSATGQTPSATLTYNGTLDKMETAITLNNPTGFSSGVSYDAANGKLLSNNTSIGSTTFTAETGYTGTALSSAKISGTMTLNYSTPAVYHAEDIAVINAMIDNNSLAWTKTGPANVNTLPSNWTGITWSSGMYDKRITEISLTNKGLTGNLDLSGLPTLTTFKGYSNSLTGIDVTGLTALTNLQIYSNQISSIDLSTNTALEQMSISTNKLTT
ncbi:MAG: hypothetical protein LBR67_01355, partial [Dysgonamonadaceae bacterium]|nr:hypothetical protein [Dysgonamonadaceae bacterium]